MFHQFTTQGDQSYRIVKFKRSAADSGGKGTDGKSRYEIGTNTGSFQCFALCRCADQKTELYSVGVFKSLS